MTDKINKGNAQKFLAQHGNMINSYDQLRKTYQVDKPGDLVGVVDSPNSFYAFFLSPEAKFMNESSDIMSVDFLAVSGDLQASVKNGNGLTLENEVWRPHNGSLSEKYSLKKNHLQKGVYRITDQELIKKVLVTQNEKNDGLPNFLATIYKEYL